MQCRVMPGNGKAHRGVLYPVEDWGLHAACWTTCSGEETEKEEQPSVAFDLQWHVSLSLYIHAHSEAA